MSQVGGALITAQRIHQDSQDTSQQAVFTVQGGACLKGGRIASLSKAEGQRGCPDYRELVYLLLS